MALWCWSSEGYYKLPAVLKYRTLFRQFHKPCPPAQHCFLSSHEIIRRLPQRNRSDFRQIAANEPDCPIHPQPHGFSSFFLHGLYQFPDGFRCLRPFFSAGTIFVGFDAGAVQTQILIIGINAQNGKHFFEHMLLIPFFESGIHGLPRAIPFR